MGIKKAGDRYLKWFLMAASAWVLAWMYFMRYCVLDDALIQLRYADFLWRYGFLTFDGVNRTLGCSSLLNFVILSIARGLTKSVFLPKILSVIFYFSLLLIVMRMAVTSRRPGRFLWAVLLAVLVSPMAMRWLADGMETGFAAAMSVLLAIYSCGLNSNPTKTSFKYLLLVMFGVLIVLLRVELAMLIAFASVSIWFYQFDRESVAGRPRRARSFFYIALRESHLALGGILGILIIYFMFGQVLPDTAAAKAGGFHVLAWLKVPTVVVSSMSLGLGLALIWVVLAAGLFKISINKRRGFWPCAIVNSLPLALAALIAIRGQRVEGIRHVLWCFVFVAAWDIRMASTLNLSPADLLGKKSLSGINARGALIITLLLIACVWGAEGHIVARIARDRSRAFLDMRGQRLGLLAGRTGVAFDIGFISYFSGAKICDMGGLVHGSEFAVKTFEERAERCAEQRPDFAYVTKSQARALEKYIDMKSWIVCYKYTFTNVKSEEPHYLIVRPALAKEVCERPMGNYGKIELQ